MQPTDWTIKVNRKERKLAVATALQSAAGDMMVTSDVRVRLQLVWVLLNLPFSSILSLVRGAHEVLQRMQEGDMHRLCQVPSLRIVLLIWHGVSRDGSRIQRLLSWRRPC